MIFSTVEHEVHNYLAVRSTGFTPPISSTTVLVLKLQVHTAYHNNTQATGVVFTDADQVAEMLLSDAQADTTEAPDDETTGRDLAGAVAGTGRFVLVDCRPASVLKTGETEPDVVGSRMEEAITGMALAGGRVVWRRIDPASFLGRESEAAAEVLKGVVAGAREGTALEVRCAERVGENGATVDCEAPRGDAIVGDSVNGSVIGVEDGTRENGKITVGVNGASSGNAADGVFAANGSVHPDKHDHKNRSSKDRNVLLPTFAAPTTVAGLAATHVCFIGSREVGELRNGNGKVPGKGKLSTAADHAAAVRLARAAARSGLARACILEGGFSAFEDALVRRVAAEQKRNTKPESLSSAAMLSSAKSSTPVGTTTPPSKAGSVAMMKGGSVVVASATPATAALVEAPTTADAAAGTAAAVEAAVEAAAAGPTPHFNNNLTIRPQGPLGGLARSRKSPPAGTTKPAVGKGHPPEIGARRLMTSTSAQPIAGGGAGNADPRRTVSERRLSSLARTMSSSKISEPFRLYAAKSADDMGRALRSLPATAGKPLEVKIWTYKAGDVCTIFVRWDSGGIGEI